LRGADQLVFAPGSLRRNERGRRSDDRAHRQRRKYAHEGRRARARPRSFRRRTRAVPRPSLARDLPRCR
jgi:hypothetical protein